MKKRFAEEQIIGFLKEAYRGVAVKELCRKHGFSEPRYNVWRNKYGGMDASDANCLEGRELENSRLKQLMADALLDDEVTKEALRKNW